MNILNLIIGITSALCALFGLHYVLIAILGGFRKARLHPKQPPKHRIAAVIAARNEEEVIGYLVESLKRQDYPEELFDVYVVPNNCSDDTHGAALRAGAKVLTCTREVHSKGEVMRFAFDELLNGEAQYDAFCIFDADNIVDPGFFQAVNNALCQGAQIAQGYRDSKNPGDSWIAGCVSMFYWGMNRLYNRARNALGLSAALNGTGFMVSAGLIRKYGWDTSSLTEDLEFTAQCAIHGVKVHWMNDAITYDEQPVTLKDSFTQRRRWSAGTLQCMKRYWGQLAQGVFKRRSFACLDMGLLFMGPVIQLICFVPGILALVQVAISLASGTLDLPALLFGAIAGALGSILGSDALGLLICLLERKTGRVRFSALANMWIFLLSWVPANLACIFFGIPKWKAIPHNRGMNLGQITGKNRDVGA
ncbi:MAG TPA: glycosyltransferase family 2 protein [Candidatus Faecaligallichristensenella faecipullorum]|nr:glycosyltransferase family 2 protein [Candidatus Faecaligallichristensenella faecipullorum]